MDYTRSWIVPATIATIIAIPVAALVLSLVREHIKARRNRLYKSLADHTILNAAGRDAWMSGVVPHGEVEEPVSRLSTLVLPFVQLAIVVVLAVVAVTSNASLSDRITHQDEELADLQTQVHALAFAPTPAPRIDDPALPPATGAMANATPMQQACANLIGRVADAYERGESSKIGDALEELVQKLKCVNTPAQQ
jgi:hypothetical protein